MPRMPIRMIALIMSAHYCPLGRLPGKGDGIRQELSGREGAAIHMRQVTGAQSRLVSESREPVRSHVTAGV